MYMVISSVIGVEDKKEKGRLFQVFLVYLTVAPATGIKLLLHSHLDIPGEVIVSSEGGFLQASTIRMIRKGSLFLHPSKFYLIGYE